MVISSPATTSWPPLELLPAVNHHREVHFHLGVEQRWRNRWGAVDDREHRRGYDVGVAGVASGFLVEMQRIGLTDRAGVLLDLLATHCICGGLVFLSDRFGVDWHRGGLLVGLEGLAGSLVSRAALLCKNCERVSSDGP